MEGLRAKTKHPRICPNLHTPADLIYRLRDCRK